MFKCLGWPCPAIYIYIYFFFLLFETPIMTLCLPAHRNTWCGNACFGAQVSSKYRTWYSERVVFAVYVRWLLGWRYISSLHSADELQEGRNSCPLLRSYFIGSCHIGVSKRFLRSISLAVYCLSSYIFLADQISCRSYVGSVYRMRSFAVSGSSLDL